MKTAFAEINNPQFYKNFLRKAYNQPIHNKYLNKYLCVNSGWNRFDERTLHEHIYINKKSPEKIKNEIIEIVKNYYNIKTKNPKLVLALFTLNKDISKIKLMACNE